MPGVCHHRALKHHKKRQQQLFVRFTTRMIAHNNRTRPPPSAKPAHTCFKSRPSRRVLVHRTDLVIYEDVPQVKEGKGLL